MKRRFVLLPVLALVAGLFGGGVAQGHSCPEGYEDQQDPECEETHTVPNWRDGNYIPLFDLQDRDDEQQRRDAQRWHDECDNWQPGQGGYQSRQMCFWMYGGFSFFEESEPNPNITEEAPNEWHAGFAASHCFLFEFAHDCEDHDPPGSEGTHDGHGGAIYADVCLSENPESKYCDDGIQDTQVGVTIMDHNPCGTVVPIVACTDEYHVIRPFDTEYTQAQMEDSAEYLQRIADDPELYLCGYEQYRAGNPVCPGPPEDEEGERASGALAPELGVPTTDLHRAASLPHAAPASIAPAGAIAGQMAGFSGTVPRSADDDAAATGWTVALIGLAIVARAGRRLFASN